MTEHPDTAGPATDKPDIVLIIADQEGCDIVRSRGPPHV